MSNHGNSLASLAENLMMEDDNDWMDPEEDALLLQAVISVEEEIEKLQTKKEGTTLTLTENESSHQKQFRWKAVYVGNSDLKSADNDLKGKVSSDIQEDLNKQEETSEVDKSGQQICNLSPSTTKCGDQNGNIEEDAIREREQLTIYNETPLQSYRGQYLKVTDLTAQAWCEQQLVYSFSVPKELLQTPAMERGTDIHLAKELEVHDIETVSVNTKEDSWAIKFLNILTSLTQLLSGAKLIREMPICGEPFEGGVLFVGIIDEIRWTDHEELELVEFKTRVRSKTLPSAAQRTTHKLQVSLYKHMFDAAVKGSLNKELLVKHLGLDMNRTLSDSVLLHTRNAGIKTDRLLELVDKTLEQFQFMQKISCLTTEYTSQSDSTPFASETYEFDEEWLQMQVEKSLQFWQGKRNPVGVDIEDAWKCHSCLFEEKCEWKQKMIEECIKKNSIKKIKTC